ncbi:MAG: flagellar biosynthesis protein FlhA [Oscillospiraceae bacterium]|nr:flagellar biosynthesis protein FlhA [Oscillospiraceae bacterium]
MKIADISISGIVIAIIAIIILPLPTWLMDSLLIINIAISVFIMLTSLYVKNILDFSIMPTLLLLTTLYRLSLNLSTTKLILGNGGDAGKVIETFGNFVIGGNLVVGVIVFIIIVAIQFIVITKGSERVSEVAARFTLDAMPGKQMAIDADLNTGAIDEATARKRRDDIQREADFYGAMDGASKFIKGDSIIGIVITLVNIVGGLIIGVAMDGMEIGEAVQVYVLATVGDGLVGQIPALLISTATGVLVTRSTAGETFGSDVARQIFGSRSVMMLCGYMLIILSFVPGFPKVPMYVVAAALIIAGVIMGNKEKKTTEKGEAPDAEKMQQAAAEAAAEKRKPENVLSLLQVEQLELEFGYGLVPMVDASLGGDLLDRIVMIRRQCAIDLGIVIPSVRLRDNVRLGANEYVLKIRGDEVARGDVMPDHYLAINSDGAEETISGIETVEPTFGLPALWITKKQREKAELLGYTTIDPPSVITTHLIEVIKNHADELIDRQQVQMLVENLAKTQPTLVEEVTPKLFTYGEIQKVLAGLLAENVPIKNLATIMETLADYGRTIHNTEDLVEKARQNMSRVITRRFLTDGDVSIVALDASLEQTIIERTRKTETGTVAILEPDQLRRLLSATRDVVNHNGMQGKKTVVLTSPAVRNKFKRLVGQAMPDLVALSYNEIEQDYEIRIDGMISI